MVSPIHHKAAFPPLAVDYTPSRHLPATPSKRNADPFPQSNSTCPVPPSVSPPLDLTTSRARHSHPSFFQYPEKGIPTASQPQPKPSRSNIPTLGVPQPLRRRRHALLPLHPALQKQLCAYDAAGQSSPSVRDWRSGIIPVHLYRRQA